MPNPSDPTSLARTTRLDSPSRWSREHVHVERGRTVTVHTRHGTTGTIVLCHPAPGAGPFDPHELSTRHSDVSLITIDRPGYGGSEPIAAGDWVSVDRAADDIAHVLDARGARPIGVAGWSAGGRVALALAARRSDLVERVAIIATPAPHEHVSWIPPHLVAAIAALDGAPPHVAHAAFEAQLADMLPADPRSAAALELLGATDADAIVFDDPASRAALTSLLASAFEQGATGLAADLAGVTLRPWGFEPADVRAPALLVYGGADPIAGPAHGQWWQRSLPDAQLEVVEDAGHCVVIAAWARVVAHLGSRTA